MVLKTLKCATTELWGKQLFKKLKVEFLQWLLFKEYKVLQQSKVNCVCEIIVTCTPFLPLLSRVDWLTQLPNKIRNTGSQNTCLNLLCPSSNQGANFSAQKSYLNLQNLSKVKTIRLSILSHTSHLFSLRYGLFNNSNTTSKNLHGIYYVPGILLSVLHI